MTTRRPPDFDLEQALTDPGFTPRQGDIPRLLDHIADGDDHAPTAERALLRVGDAAGRAAALSAVVAEPAARARLTRFVGRAAASSGDAELADFLCARLDDADTRTRRAAAIALGKARPEGAEQALAKALAGEADPSVRNALVEAIGKVGGAGALAVLDRVESGPGEPKRTETRAKLMVTRTLARATPGAVEVSRAAPGPTKVSLRCRRGLEGLLIAGLDPDLEPELLRTAPGGIRVEVTLTGPLARIFRSRTMLSFGLPLPEIRHEGGEVATAIAEALTQPSALRLLRHFTIGPLRYRIAWAKGGKRRATLWQIAAEVARRCPADEPLINDPTASPWEAVVYEAPGVLQVELCPNVGDPRFAYRSGDVSGASHPTIAAALVQVSGVRPDDVVWDPFVGSATELCERAVAGPFELLIGSDLSPAALSVARKNLAGAGVHASKMELFPGDATLLVPPRRPSLIITNPPLGRRVSRMAELAPMLDRFIENAVRSLAPDGRLVWVSPFPARSLAVAQRSGLTLTRAEDVDMGGFFAQMQAFRRQRPPRAPSRADRSRDSGGTRR
jgi:23S rRNA G2445 N2-methylase RlmL